MASGVNIILLVTYFTGIGESFGVSVNASIYIENLSQWNLVNGRYWTNRGKVISSPLKVTSGETEIWETQKSWGVYGTSGIIVYDLEDSSSTSIAIVWEAPYNLVSDKNDLALGILNRTTEGKLFYGTSGIIVYDHGDLYGKLVSNQGDFSRCHQNYDKTVTPCQVSCHLSCQSQIRMIGTMGTGNKPKIHITVLPLNEDDYWSGSLGEKWTPIEQLTPGTSLLGTSENAVTAALGISIKNQAWVIFCTNVFTLQLPNMQYLLL